MPDATENKKHRSPNYPYIGLKKAIDLVGKLYEKDKRAKVPLNIAYKRWDYTEGSSVGGQCVAALRAFGLLDVEGSGDQRRVCVSEVALRYLVGREDLRKGILQECALRPSIYSQVWENFEGEIPQEDVLRDYLIFSLNFNSSTVRQFVAPFRETVTFAGLQKGDYTDSEGDRDSGLTADESQTDHMDQAVNTRTPQSAEARVNPQSQVAVGLRQVQADQRELRFHLPSGDVSLLIPSAMTADEFDILQAYLGAFKLSLAKMPKVTDAQEN